MLTIQDLKAATVFIGINSNPALGRLGTGYFVSYRSHNYLVISDHVKVFLEQHPAFDIYTNNPAGDLTFIQSLPTSGKSWIGHSDASVDLAVMPFPFQYPPDQLIIRPILASSFLASEDQITEGVICYSASMSSMIRNDQKILPVVRSGSLALKCVPRHVGSVPWRKQPEPLFIDTHVVQMPNEAGNSGSPVAVQVASGGLKLLGTWKSGLDTVPTAGMGNVVPVSFLRQMLDSPAGQATRA